ncbi:MAG TPA: polymer-forming cytoskeletal protein [Terriglobales bacterium]|nr:polymer-forming cytoskeletal protein [Terriglobales bacterium]
MWKPRKEDEPHKPVSQTPTYTPVVTKEVHPVEIPKSFESRADVAHIGKSVLIKGELSGSEDLYLDGEVEGTIELQKNSLTIGPNGRIRAHVNAREVVVHGKVDGNIRGTDKVELKRTAVLVGDISTQRIVIEDGAYFKGGIDIQRETKAEVKKEPAAYAAAASAGAVVQGTLVEKK